MICIFSADSEKREPVVYAHLGARKAQMQSAVMDEFIFCSADRAKSNITITTSVHSFLFEKNKLYAL